jgi:transposase
MVTIGVDPHKQTHTAAAVDQLGVEREHKTAPARPAGNGQLLEWARALDAERVLAVEDVRNVSGSLERFLINRGEVVVRLAPQLMADARRGARTSGKSDPIDALAITRAALREGVQNPPTAGLAGTEREIRQLALYRERRLDTRIRLVNELRWQLHDLWPNWEIPAKALTQPGWQTKVANRLTRTEQTIQVQIARDMTRRARELSAQPKTSTTSRRARHPSRATAARRARNRRALSRQVHRRDRRDRPLHLRRTARPPRRVRSDPRVLPPLRPPPP